MMTKAVILAATLAACGVQDLGGGAGLDLTFLNSLGASFGEVFQCTVEEDPPATLELCWRDGDATELADSVAEALGDYVVLCVPTPRHAGVCIYGCEPHSGCNAFSGCWCNS